MYLVRPSDIHEAAVTDFVNRCCKNEDIDEVSRDLASVLKQVGYKAWKEMIPSRRIARYDGDSKVIVPGYTLLLCEYGLEQEGDGLETYTRQFPVFGNGNHLVGVVTLGAVENREQQIAGNATIFLTDTASLRFSLLPIYRSLASYILMLQDILTYIICEGLPYKYLVYCCSEAATSSDIQAALKVCSFDLQESGSSNESEFYKVDLRVAHQLRTRIQEWSRKEG